MGDSFQEVTTVATYHSNMKYLVSLGLLLVSMAKGQEKIDAASLNAVLPEGYTRVCKEGEEPRGAQQGEPRGKRQVDGSDNPCWTIVDADFDSSKCSSFENTCSTKKPYVGRGQNTMCIYFPNAGKWFKLPGTYGWCGADECCDFHPKKDCNPARPLLTYFPLPAGKASCAEVSNKEDLSTVGSELMKGEEGTRRTICVLNKDKEWNEEPVDLFECGGFECCRFKLVNAE